MMLEPKDQRVPVMMTASELRAIDDWSFQQRIRSRGEAIRRLIDQGLKACSTVEQASEPPNVNPLLHNQAISSGRTIL